MRRPRGVLWVVWASGVLLVGGLSFLMGREYPRDRLPAAHASFGEREAVVPAEREPQIRAMSASPDGSRLLVFPRTAGDLQEYVLIDLETGAELTRGAFFGSGTTAVWNPDSQWAAFGADGGTLVLLLSRGGEQLRQVEFPVNVKQLQWHPTLPPRLVALAVEDPRALLELEVDTARIRRRALSLAGAAPYAGILSLFPVRDQLCVSYHRETPGRHHGELVAVPVDGGAPVLRVPLSGKIVDEWEYSWDYLDLQVSPDGKTFYVLFGASASTNHLIGRSVDAAIVFREPHRALTYDPEFFTNWQVRWSLAGPERRQAFIHERNGSFRFVLDLETGSRQGPTAGEVDLLEPVPGRREVGAIGAALRWNDSSFAWASGALLATVASENPEP